MKLFLYLCSMSYGGIGDTKTMFHVFLNYKINSITFSLPYSHTKEFLISTEQNNRWAYEPV